VHAGILGLGSRAQQRADRDRSSRAIDGASIFKERGTRQCVVARVLTACREPTARDSFRMRHAACSFAAVRAAFAAGGAVLRSDPASRNRSEDNMKLEHERLAEVHLALPLLRCIAIEIQERTAACQRIEAVIGARRPTRRPRAVNVQALAARLAEHRAELRSAATELKRLGWSILRADSEQILLMGSSFLLDVRRDLAGPRHKIPARVAG